MDIINIFFFHLDFQLENRPSEKNGVLLWNSRYLWTREKLQSNLALLFSLRAASCDFTGLRSSRTEPGAFSHDYRKGKRWKSWRWGQLHLLYVHMAGVCRHAACVIGPCTCPLHPPMLLFYRSRTVNALLQHENFRSSWAARDLLSLYLLEHHFNRQVLIEQLSNMHDIILWATWDIVWLGFGEICLLSRFLNQAAERQGL